MTDTNDKMTDEVKEFDLDAITDALKLISDAGLENDKRLLALIQTNSEGNLKACDSILTLVESLVKRVLSMERRIRDLEDLAQNSDTTIN